MKSSKFMMLSCAALVFGFAGMASAHPGVILKDAAGNAITDFDAGAAYSVEQSCGIGQASYCHDIGAIENHSYHALLGSNELKGWDSWNPNSPDKYKAGVAAKGKSWVQSPGHVGKW
ncbi:MAG: cytochrome C [Desulfuromonas sp.]|nr:MAG: cytochrome C [Desulfuromonas sp.]